MLELAEERSLVGIVPLAAPNLNPNRRWSAVHGFHPRYDGGGLLVLTDVIAYSALTKMCLLKWAA